MYSTCIFCHAGLGSNEELEHMTVGKRLAFDSERGRLWVLCKTCSRWNLSPLETRWEAIEEAERQFRATRLRVSTDNIAMAQTRSGLELVRIGKPPQLEFAAWRYGKLFRVRRNRHLVITAVGTALALVQPAVMFGGMAVPAVAQLSMFGALGAVSNSVYTIIRGRRDRKKVRTVVRDRHGEPLHITQANAAAMSLIHVAHNREWKLRLPYLTRYDDDNGKYHEEQVVLEGDEAMRVLGAVLPHVNRDGGTERRVREAVDVISQAASPYRLMYDAATSKEGRNGNRIGEPTISALPPRLRLAMEMALHEGDERRALEGELEELHNRWRDAEEVARIADNLLIPDWVQQRMRRSDT